MPVSNKMKKAARELQELGGGVPSYTACRNLFIQHGLEEAKKRVLEMVSNADAEIAALKIEVDT